MTKYLRSVACLVVLAMIAAACTQTEADTTTTLVSNSPEADPPVTVVRNSPEAKAMIDAAMGGTQAVQDFVIHIDLAEQTGETSESFYQDVVALAIAEVGESFELAGGFTFVPVESIEAEVIDSNGTVLPTLAVDFGLLTFTEDAFGVSRSSLLEAFPSDQTELLGFIDTLQSEGSGLLVEVITADFSQARTHVGPGDRTAIDLTSISSVAPGDAVTSLHVFGQTLPGDPEEESGLTAHELFSYRWNQGLVNVLGSEDGPSFVNDQTLRVVEGSTILTRDAKYALVTAFSVMSAIEALELLPFGREWGYNEPDSAVEVARGDGWLATFNIFGAPYSVRPDFAICLHVVGSDGTVGDRRCEYINDLDLQPVDTSPRFVLMTLVGLLRCAELAGEMYRRNQGAGIPVNEIRSAFGRPPLEPASTTTTDPDLRHPLDPPDSTDPFDSLVPPADPRGLCELPRRAGRTAGMFGDVHFTTFDQLIIQNQAAGEFLVFDNEVATVQMRTEPWEDSDSVSVATAVAARMGDHTVSIHLDTESSSGLTYIDGVLAETDRGEAVAIGGAALSWSGFGWMVVWPDGTELQVFPDTTGLVVFVTSDSTSVGMLGGDGDGIAENDRVTRSGAVMPFDRSEPTSWEEHYGVYVDSWRITREESLFYYGPGESTETYTLEGFPASYWEVADLDPVVRDEAEAVCVDGGITREDILDACVLDVALTGDPAFAFAAYRVQASIPSHASPLGGSVVGPSLPGTEDMLVVGDFTFEFGADHRFTEGPQAFGGCRFNEFIADHLFASTRFTAEDGATMDFRFEYLPPDATGNGKEALEILAQEDGNIVVWAQINWEGVPLTAGSIEAISRADNTVSITGTAYLNEDPLFRFSNIYQELPDGARFLPFTLRVTCHSS